jgi:hypothetical protein
MKNPTNQIKDRVFVLTKEKAPLSYTLPSRNTKRFSLLYFDGTVNRALRYSRNQKSVFEDEQDDKAILEPIIFEDGTLVVPSSNPILGKFLDMHPLNGDVFKELNTEKETTLDIEELNIELDAQIAAREMSLETMESVGRLIYGGVIDTMTTPELKRDILLYARNYPIQFLEMINDPGLAETAMASKALSAGLFALRNNNREIWFNMPGNKRKLMNLQPGDDPVSVLTTFFESEEGKAIEEVVKSKLS